MWKNEGYFLPLKKIDISEKESPLLEDVELSPSLDDKPPSCYENFAKQLTCFVDVAVDKSFCSLENRVRSSFARFAVNETPLDDESHISSSEFISIPRGEETSGSPSQETMDNIELTSLPLNNPSNSDNNDRLTKIIKSLSNSLSSSLEGLCITEPASEGVSSTDFLSDDIETLFTTPSEKIESMKIPSEPSLEADNMSLSATVEAGQEISEKMKSSPKPLELPCMDEGQKVPLESPPNSPGVSGLQDADNSPLSLTVEADQKSSEDICSPPKSLEIPDLGEDQRVSEKIESPLKALEDAEGVGNIENPLESPLETASKSHEAAGIKDADKSPLPVTFEANQTASGKIDSFLQPFFVEENQRDTEKIENPEKNKSPSINDKKTTSSNEVKREKRGRIPIEYIMEFL